jgi:hypothetical protein
MKPLDFFAWGFIKDVAYRRKVQDVADLRQRIIEAVELITPHMLINKWQELEYRLDICRELCQADIQKTSQPTAVCTHTPFFINKIS